MTPSSACVAIVLLLVLHLLPASPLHGYAAEPAASPQVAAPDSLPLYTVPPVRVHAFRSLLIGGTRIEPREAGLRPPADGGDLLTLLPGITGSRIGGHGTEPVIRGQRETRLNVLADGAFVHGGCPNRMDPPSALMDVEAADRIVVLRGVQSVVHGPGGTGGTVLFESLPPHFAPDASLLGSFSVGADENARGLLASGRLAVREDAFYAHASARRHEARDYEDGDGNRVRSGFAQSGAVLRFGWSPDLEARRPSDHLEMTVEFDRTSDARFAGAGMDSPYSELLGLRVRGERRLDAGPLRKLRASAYLSAVDHEMDNYTLRPAAANFRVARTTSDTFGGRVLADLEGRAGAVTLGADIQRMAQDGIRYGNNTDPASVDQIQAVLWPDLTLTDLGLFAEARRELHPRVHAVAGVRVDRVAFRFGDPDREPTLATMGLLRSPNDLYRAFYGLEAEEVDETNLGGLLRLEVSAARGLVLRAGASRTLRTANPTERGMASEMAGMSWVGNPALDPETHHQVDLGFAWNRPLAGVSASVYADRVTDYILRDSARGQDGVLVNLPMADVYRNVDATLAGVELEAAFRPLARWEFDLDAMFSWGEIDDTGAPLPQIPALQGNLTVTHDRGTWSGGARLHAAARQTRADTDPMTGTGLDAGETPGYAVLDLFGTRSLGKDTALRFGISNLFDKAWANHLNRENGVDNTVLQVREPGRSIHAGLSVAY